MGRDQTGDVVERRYAGTASFCSPHANAIVAEQKRADGITVAAYAIERQLHGGTGPYDSAVAKTELRRIVFDGLVKANPCKRQ